MTHAPQPKSHTLVLAGEARMKLAPPWVTYQNIKEMGALLATTWKVKMSQKVRAPTIKALAVSAGNPAAKMRSQAVGAAVSQESEKETPKAKPDQPPPEAPLEVNHNALQTPLPPELNDKDSEDEQRSNRHDFVCSQDIDFGE